MTIFLPTIKKYKFLTILFPWIVLNLNIPSSRCVEGKGYDNIELVGAEFVEGSADCCTYKMGVGDQIIIKTYFYDESGNRINTNETPNYNFSSKYYNNTDKDRYFYYNFKFETINDNITNSMIKEFYNNEYIIMKFSGDDNYHNINPNDTMTIKIINK